MSRLLTCRNGHQSPDAESSRGPGRADDDNQQGSDSLSLLSSCFPFSELPVPVVRVLQSRMHEVAFSDGEFLMRQGDQGDSLMLICDGVAEVRTVDELGNPIHIDTAERGQLMGEMALLTGEPRTADVIARSPLRALVLSANAFHDLAGHFPQLSLVLTNLVGQRLGSHDRDALTGKTFCGCRIRRRLGKGGMSVVYEAEETATGRRVALKMLSHRLTCNPQALAQFHYEADIIQSFDHQSILPIYGRFAAFRTLFIAMQFCDGVTLRGAIRQSGPFPEAEVRKVLGQLASALSYAHKAGIVHRDVKPSNIMLTREGIVKLMDFGLAKPVEESGWHSHDHVVGTPGYMAFEQLIGENAGAEADVFSLGCVAYEMLTAKRLFRAKTFLELLAEFDGWVPPNLKNVRADLSHDLCDAIEQCLQRSRLDRRVDLDRLASWAAPVSMAIVGHCE